MSYEESVDWLFEQFPAYQKIGASAYKPDLDNVLYLCNYFQLSFSSLKFIHIAGTNGKGSTSNYLASILQEAGYKTALFTSPHILDFRERIRINGEKIREEQVMSFCEQIRNSDLKVKPSFFEITWVLALRHFLENECEICVIETGLGGRLDSTNIITPILSIITNIGLDHTSILGNTAEKIAFEKAGIIKQHVPVVIGEFQEAVYPVLEKKAISFGAEIHLADDFKVKSPFFPMDSYLFKNERTVRQALAVLDKMNFHVSEELISKGFKDVSKNTGFSGRFQQISEKPLVILDAAHNTDGIRELIKSISSLEFKNLFLVYGASNDKNIGEILEQFPPETHFSLCAFSNPRSMTFSQLVDFKEQSNLNASVFENIKEAFEFVCSQPGENDLILITGSFFLLSDFFSFFSENNL